MRRRVRTHMPVDQLALGLEKRWCYRLHWLMRPLVTEAGYPGRFVVRIGPGAGWTKGSGKKQAVVQVPLYWYLRVYLRCIKVDGLLVLDVLDGDDSEVTAMVADPKNGRQPVAAVLRKEDGTWRRTRMRTQGRNSAKVRRGAAGGPRRKPAKPYSWL